MMDYVACHTDGCANRGAPYATSDADATPSCPVCENPMATIPPPDLTPPAPEPPPPPPDPATKLALARLSAQRRVRAALTETDLWCIRHVEDGISLTPARITYRQTLRALLAKIQTSADPGSVSIPDPPAPPIPSGLSAPS